ncbi:MAG: CHASE2 domain-containing protein [Hyphomicrobiaceae bacterium]|nr:CHASE2 domain-containing protein [Hyphomicrobiaceae bacterium]
MPGKQVEDGAVGGRDGRPARRPAKRGARVRILLLRIVAGGALAVAAAFLLETAGRDFPLILRVEHQLADWRTGLLSDRPAGQNARIAVVLIDDRSLRSLPYTSPIDRGYLAGLVRRLDEAGAKAIALDIVFQRPTEPAKDEALAKALREARAEIVIAVGDERTWGLDEEEVAYQRAFAASTGRATGYVNLDADRDGVVRHRLGPNAEGSYPVSFAARVAQADGARDDDPAGRMAWLKRPLDNTDTFFKINAAAVMDDGPVGKLLRERLAGRLVLIGGAFIDRDLHRTPLFARDGEAGREIVHGVFLHAHAIAQILDGRYVRETASLPVVLLVSFAGFMLGSGFQGRGFRWLTGGLWTAVLIGVDLALYWQLRWVVPYVMATLGWVAGVVSGYIAARMLVRLGLKGGEDHGAP